MQPFLVETRSVEEQALTRLNRVLDYEIKSTALLVLLFFLPIGPVVSLLYLLVFASLPFLVLNLVKARWIGWAVWFVVSVALGWTLPRIIEMDPRMWFVVRAMSLFVPFYFSCWILRWQVNDAVTEMKDEEALAHMSAQEDSA